MAYRSIIFGLLAILACNSRTQYEVEPNATYIQEAQHRAVRVEASQLMDVVQCSGVVYMAFASTGYVLTAAHCLPPNGFHEDARVNGHPAYIVRKDDKHDLALLLYYTQEQFAPLCIKDQVHPTDKIFSVADPAGYRVVSIGRILRVEQEAIFVTTTAAHGASGGAVYDRNGNLVGILNLMLTDNGSIVNGAAIRGHVIERFLNAP